MNCFLCQWLVHSVLGRPSSGNLSEVLTDMASRIANTLCPATRQPANNSLGAALQAFIPLQEVSGVVREVHSAARGHGELT